jgi:hypothetical protein
VLSNSYWMWFSVSAICSMACNRASQDSNIAAYGVPSSCAACQDYHPEHCHCQALLCLYAGACNSTGAMHPRAHHIAHGQRTGPLAKQQSVALGFSLESPATLPCHNKGAAHVAAAKNTHQMHCPAATGLQLRQVAVQAMVQPDIGSERDPLAGEYCLLVCESIVYLCVGALSTCV